MNLEVQCLAAPVSGPVSRDRPQDPVLGACEKYIWLRSPCSAKARGVHPWTPVRRMRRTPVFLAPGKPVLIRTPLRGLRRVHERSGPTRALTEGLLR